jgi:hypothetical protein
LREAGGAGGLKGKLMHHLLNVVTIFGLVLFLVVLISVRRSHIRVEYSVTWLGAAVTLIVLSRSDTVMNWLTSALGVSDPAIALIMIVFCVFLVVFYRFSVIISDLKDANIALAQRVAILEFQIEALNEKQQTLERY